MALVLVDDLTRVEITDPDHEPTVIVVDGAAVELDLSAESRERLHLLLAPYYTAGRPERVESTATAPESPAAPDLVEHLVTVLDDVRLDPVAAVSLATLPSGANGAIEAAAAPPAEVIPDAVIRKWARQHGVHCPASGQVQASVRRLYAESAGGPPRSGASS